jgi:transmembrane sensor
MEHQNAKTLLSKYQSGQATDAERAMLEKWILQYNEDQTELHSQRIEELAGQIYKQLPGKKHRQNIRLWSIVTTAAALTLLTLGTWIYFGKTPISQTAPVSDILPGTNKAILSLANGRTINLKSNKTGINISADNITYNDGTKINTQVIPILPSMPLGPVPEPGPTSLNTITVPKGGQYQLRLSDGTKVWLNASSILHFPASFSGLSERKIELLGEAYFEVAKDSKHPFIVKTHRQQIKVLGTHFNLEAYPTQDITTTLLEGSVKVSDATRPVSGAIILKPGEQSRYIAGKLSSQPADLTLVLAWKKGKTVFKNAELKTIMTQLERWYNFETIYKSYPAEARFSGSVSRSKNISQVLDLLASTGEVHFKVEERKVIVMK